MEFHGHSSYAVTVAAGMYTDSYNQPFPFTVSGVVSAIAMSEDVKINAAVSSTEADRLWVYFGNNASWGYNAVSVGVQFLVYATM